MGLQISYITPWKNDKEKTKKNQLILLALYQINTKVKEI